MRIALWIVLGLTALLAGPVTVFASGPSPSSKEATARRGQGPLPNLTVGKLPRLPAKLVAGSKLKVVVKVRNAGATKAGKSSLAVSLVKITKGRKGRRKESKRLKRAKVKPLGPGKKAKVKLTVVLPAKSAAGTYQLLACADDTKRVTESREGDNCESSKTFKLTPAPPPPSAAPAFTLSDGFSWEFGEDAERNAARAGGVITTTMTAANGVAGQAGYTRSAVPPSPLVSGPVTNLTFAGGADEGTVTEALPFVFPFGGVVESSLSVSTNGRVSFGDPAPEGFNLPSTDYRGQGLVIGDFFRGIMPYWGDLDLENQGAGMGTVKEIVPADHSSVAFQWDAGQFSGAPRRTFQLVLFPDGRFRFDYPGANTPGGEEAFIGYSLGTGPGAMDTVATNVTTVPPTSILYTPNPVVAGTALAAGQASMTVPAASTFISAGPGCVLTKAPAQFEAGLVSCPIGQLLPGQQASQGVTFAVPQNAPGEVHPANFRYLGAYQSGAFTLTDRDEADLLNSDLRPTSPKIVVTPPAAPQVGVETQFSVEISSSVGGSGLDEPIVTFSLPANTTFDSIKIAGAPIQCGAVAAGLVTCELPSGTKSTKPIVTVTPSALAVGAALTLVVSAQAFNAPIATESATSAASVAP
jgi:hypothetical protein